MVVSGMAGPFFVVAANAWMNNPTGFRLDADGRVVDARPWAAMFGPSTWPQVVHMLLGAYMVVGFTVGLGLRGRDAAGAPRPAPLPRPAHPAHPGGRRRARADRRRRLDRGDGGREPAPPKLAAMEGAVPDDGRCAAVGGRPVPEQPDALRAGDPEGAVAAGGPQPERVWSAGWRSSPGRAPGGQRRAPRLRHDGRARQRPAPAGRRLRHRRGGGDGASLARRGSSAPWRCPAPRRSSPSRRGG